MPLFVDLYFYKSMKSQKRVVKEWELMQNNTTPNLMIKLHSDKKAFYKWKTPHTPTSINKIGEIGTCKEKQCKTRWNCCIELEI